MYALYTHMYALYTHCTRTIYTLYNTIYTLYTLYTHYVRIIYALYTLCTCVCMCACVCVCVYVCVYVHPYPGIHPLRGPVHNHKTQPGVVTGRGGLRKMLQMITYPEPRFAIRLHTCLCAPTMPPYNYTIHLLGQRAGGSPIPIGLHQGSAEALPHRC